VMRRRRAAPVIVAALLGVTGPLATAVPAQLRGDPRCANPTYDAGSDAPDFFNERWSTNDVLDGYGENDIMSGGGGDDRICGGPGNDRLYGDEGNDVLIGGPGNDYCEGGLGDDVFIECETVVQEVGPTP
ncbi:MAG: calcium-binding protein, partial [Actinomycetota bacterium]